MDIAIRASDRPETGVLVVPAGVRVEQSIVCDATLPYKTLFIILEPYTQLNLLDYSHVHTVKIALHEHATLRLKGGVTRAGEKKLDIELEGRKAYADIVYAYALCGQERATFFVHQNHKLPDAYSRVELRGVLADRASVEHAGKIFVASTAALSHAEHYNKTILMSGDSRLISMPDLEVLHQNVQCSHGSAVGPLEEEHILYMCSRGISRTMAKNLLLRSFLGLTDCDQEKASQELINKVREIG